MEVRLEGTQFALRGGRECLWAVNVTGHIKFSIRCEMQAHAKSGRVRLTGRTCM